MTREIEGFKVRSTFKDHTGKKYYNLQIGKLERRSDNGLFWLWNAICDCGNSKLINASDAKRGKVKSCGCLSEQNAVNFSNKYKTHGMAGTVEQKAWKRIIQRCTNANNQDYEVYSKIGISDTIRKDFMAFYQDIGPAPEGKVSVDRIDNTKGYIEGNLRWADDVQQARNKGKYSNNKTGHTGVHYTAPKDVGMYTATWRENKTPKAKSFSVGKYGDELAFFLACEYRDLMIQRLNLAGAGYTENHGKEKTKE